MVYMLFPWHFSGILWHPGGIPWDTEDRIILTVQIYGIWDSDKISEWKAIDIATLLKIWCRIHWNARSFHFVDHGVNWNKQHMFNINFLIE